MVAGAALSFVAGAVTSIATQMVFDHKKITEINPVDVITSGIGSALGVIGISTAAQVAFTIGGSIASSLYDGERIEKSIVNGAIDGAWDCYLKEDYLYMDQVDRIGKADIKTAPISGTLPKAIPAGVNAVAGMLKRQPERQPKRQKGLRLIFMNGEINWVY